MTMTRDDIINDLMRRRPRGPGREEIVYEVTRSSKWCYKTCDYKLTAIPSLSQFGYTDDEFFDLEFKSRSAVEHYIRRRDFNGDSDYTLGGRKATLSRRVNLVWKRIEDPVYRVTQVGGEGVYAIACDNYSRSIGNLYARSMAEAKETANLFFGYLFPNDYLRVKFQRRGDVSEISALNIETVSQIEDRIEASKRQIKEQQEKIEKYEAMLMTLKTVESQQIAVETVEALNRADQNLQTAV